MAEESVGAQARTQVNIKLQHSTQGRNIQHRVSRSPRGDHTVDVLLCDCLPKQGGLNQGVLIGRGHSKQLTYISLGAGSHSMLQSSDVRTTEVPTQIAGFDPSVFGVRLYVSRS